MKNKKCTKCNKIKSIAHFTKDVSFKDSLSPYCKKCAAKIRSERAKIINANNRRYKARNKDKIAESAKAYREKNRERLIKNAKKYRKENDLYIRKSRLSPKHKYKRLKESAKLRKLELNIDFDTYCNIIEKRQCYYCDSSFGTETGSNLNRIDNTKGYSIDNVKPCCATCNYIMLDFSKNELLARLNKIARRL